jgi:hypothetical protein
MKRRAKLRVIELSYTASVGWWCRPFTSLRVVPLVMNTRSDAAGGWLRRLSSLNASIGTAGMPDQRFTLRGVAPRRWQKRRYGSSFAYW